jgi:Ca2+-binding RTX toxin-like protein
MSCPPDRTDPPPSRNDCDLNEIWNSAWEQARSDTIGGLPNFLQSLVLSLLGGGVAGTIARRVGDGLSDIARDIYEQVVGSLTAGAGESGQAASEGESLTSADIAGIVGSIVGGIAVVGVFGLLAAPPSALVVGALAAAMSAAVGILAETVARANQIYDERVANCSEDDRDRPDPLPGNTSPADCPPVSPLIVDLDGDGVETLSLDAAGVFFDLDGDGRAERTGWVAPDDALLVLDRNADGQINDISELFGSQTEDGFSELRRQDGNGDGRIDAQDDVFEDLRLWRDANSDGIAQEEELLTLEEAGITGIDLDATLVDFRVDAGAVTHAGTARLADGSTAEILDVWFDNNTAWTDGGETPDLSVAALRLPGLKGSGQVADLWVAMDEDPALMEAVRDLLVAMPSMSSADYRTAIEDLVSQWAGVEDVPAFARGEWMDGQHLAVLEAFIDFDYRQLTGTNAGTGDPGPNAAYVIEQQYDDLISRFMTEFAAQSGLASLLLVQDLAFAGDARAVSLAESLTDTSALVLSSLSYDLITTRVALSSAENAIADILRGMPADDGIVYLDRYLGRLVGLEREHFGQDREAWETWLGEQLAPIEDLALREVALKLALGHDLFTGTDGDDTIVTGDMAPGGLVRQPQVEQAIILGAAGDDTLDGNAGGDTYVFRLGDGNDTIVDSFFDGIGGFAGGSRVDTFGNAVPGLRNAYLESLDTIVFPGRNAADAVFSVDGEDLVITFTDTSGDSLRIVGQFAFGDPVDVAGFRYPVGSYGAIERFIFADTRLDGALQAGATDGDDIIIGGFNDEIFRGGPGDDTLTGGGGDDVFVYAAGDGDDVIAEVPIPEFGDWVLGSFTGDRIQFTDFNLSDLALTRSGNDVILTFPGTAGSITILGQGRSDRLGTYRAEAIEGIEFADGTILRMDVVDYALNGPPDAGGYPYLYTAADADAAGVVRDTGPLFANGVFVGGAVPVTFDGGPGHDTYILSQADAPVTINDRVVSFDDIARYQNDEDVLILRDMVLADLSFVRTSGEDMILSHMGEEIARITTQFRSNSTFGIERRDGVEKIIDADGRVITKADWASLTTSVGTDGDDVFRGIVYTRNDDSVFYNDDTYIGGRGNDQFRDEGGSDTYIYALGDGADLIFDEASTFRADPGNDEDRLVLTDLTLADVRLERAGTFGGGFFELGGTGAYGDLRIVVTQDGGQIDVIGQFIDDLTGLERIEFADGTVLDRDQIAELAFVYGTDDFDVLSVFGADEVTVVAGPGDDLIETDSAGVRAIYRLGDGQDIMNGVEILQLDDIASDGIRLLRGTDDTVRLVIRSTGEEVTLGPRESDRGGPGFPPVVALFAPLTFDPALDPMVDLTSVEAALSGTALREIRFSTGEVWDAAAIVANLELPTSDGDDVVIGGDAPDLVFGGAGDDDLFGGGGNDTLSGGAGFDTVRGGDGDDVILMSEDGDASLDGGSGRDRVDASLLSGPVVIDLAAGTADGTPVSGFEDATGGRGDDLVRGDDGDNLLAGGPGDDTLQGGGGDDTLEGGRGADRLEGGDGNDTASYISSRSGVTVALDGTPGAGGHARGDVLSGIENLTGSNYSDRLSGDGGANVLRGLNGDDTLDGQGGDDTLDGGRGSDLLLGGDGADALSGGAGADRLFGGDGDDTLRGDEGRDTLDGGAGNDTYVWASGDGDDIIADSGPNDDTDVLVLEDVSSDAVTLVRLGAQMNIRIGLAQTLVVRDQFAGGGIEEIRFADGSVLTRDAFAASAVEAPNQAPLAFADLGLNVGKGTTVIAAADLLRNDYDYEGADLVILGIEEVRGGTAVLTAAGDVEFTASRDSAGLGGFTYVVSDGALTARGTVEVIIPVNTAPVLAVPLADRSFDEDSPVFFAIPSGSFVDVDGDGLSLTATLADGRPLPGWLVFDGMAFAGTPPRDFNGDLKIAVTASDGIARVTDRFTLAIAPVNDAPVAQNDSGPVVDAGASVVILAADLLRNDSDPDGDALSIVAVTSGRGGAVALNARGDVEFTADRDADGPASFTYTVSDGSLTTTATVSLTITGAPEPDPYADYVQGTEGRDVMFAGLFRPVALFGAGGNDVLLGGFGNDRLAGGKGNDRIFGGFGGDLIEGNTGKDQLWGGPGSDTFVFREGDGKDWIMDFTTLSWFGADKVALDVDGIDTAADALAMASQRGLSVVFDFGGGDTLQLLGVRLSNLDAGDFIFL